MSFASAFILASPLLLAPPVPVAMVDAPIAAAARTELAPPIRTRSSRTQPALIPITWSLTGVQDQGTDLQEGEPGAQDIGPELTGNAAADGPQDAAQGDEIVVEGTYGPSAGDPVAVFNETTYRITQDLDEVFLEPLAYGYRDGLPGPIRDGLGNVVRNLGEPANFLNYLLQFKFGKAFETLGRFAINSTLGLGGLIDIAEKPGIGLPYRRNGFANTLGYYGVGPGAYLYLPVTGATSARDLIGNTLDQFILPVAIGAPFDRPEYAASYFIINGLDARLEFDAELARIGETVDPYAARRDSYLYRRERDIAALRGKEPPEPPAILEEVEGTGEFAEDADEAFLDETDEPEGEPGASAEDAPQISYEDTLETGTEQPALAQSVVLTHPWGR